MTMTAGQLGALRTRMMKAAAKGRSVARATDYVDQLADMGGDPDPGHLAVGSAAHLMAMCDEVLGGSEPKKKKKAKKAAPKPKAKAAAPPPPPPPPSSPSIHVEDEEDEYSAWSKTELYDEAQERDLDGRSNMSKAELVTALEADDAAAEAEESDPPPASE